MKFLKLILLFTFVPHSIFSQEFDVAQYAVTDKTALEIPASMTKSTDLIAQYVRSNFKSDQDKVRAAFVWVASNIAYETKYSYNIYENRDQKIVRALKTRKGICENYAALFSEICNKSGIKSYVIEGYTKRNSTINSQSHVWNASLIDGCWYLFDPTWGAGQIDNNSFVKKLNNKYFCQKPEDFLAVHMPFDYLWQFVDNPMSYEEFNNKTVARKRKNKKFRLNDALETYDSQSREARLHSILARIDKNGEKNDLIVQQSKYLTSAIFNIEQNKIINQYNIAASYYNKGLSEYKELINIKKSKSLPLTTHAKIEEIVDSAADKLQKAKTILTKLPEADAKITATIRQLSQSVDEVFSDVANQKLWLESYLAEIQSVRKYKSRI